MQAVVFDFDGVLVDTEPLHFEAFQMTLEPLGAALDHATYRELALGRSDRAGVEGLCGRAGIPFTNELLGELVGRKAGNMLALVEGGVSPCPGAVELLRSVASSVPVALCTGALRADVEAILPAIPPGDLADLFGCIVTADDVRHSKPDPESYRLAVQGLGADPTVCVAIEDTPSGLRAARAAGLATLAVAHTCPPAELTDADRVVSDLGSVTVDDLASLVEGHEA